MWSRQLDVIAVSNALVAMDLTAFSDDSKEKMHYYFNHNKQFQLLLECPDRVPISAWPKIFEIAQQCEYGTTLIFGGLHGLGASVG